MVAADDGNGRLSIGEKSQPMETHFARLSKAQVNQKMDVSELDL
ncbi:MAG: hypothetical protein LZF60_280006 [Nitrospira sp.]|nr:MAG: hypothetical protein LZF60_280006 [Nitrospira sp.]